MFFNSAIAKVVIALALVSAVAAEPTSLEARQVQTCTSLLCTPPPATNTCGTGCTCARVLPSVPPIPNVLGLCRPSGCLTRRCTTNADCPATTACPNPRINIPVVGNVTVTARCNTALGTCSSVAIARV